MSLWKQIFLGVLGGLVLGFAIAEGMAYFRAQQVVATNQSEFVSWDLLNELDYRTGNIPDALAKFSGDWVHIPGYVVPLAGDYLEYISEFLLVPVYGMCIHIPPPPPNQMIYVKMETGFHYTQALNGVWLIGQLAIEEMTSEYGSAGFVMKNASILPYEEPDQVEPIL